MGILPRLLLSFCLLATLNLDVSIGIWSWPSHHWCPLTCAKCEDGSSKCLQCKAWMKMTDRGICIPDTSECAEHCHYCARNGKTKCDRCLQGYTLTLQKTCSADAKCADHCHTCPFSGEAKCDACQSGYTRTANNTCTERAKCADHCRMCLYSGEAKCDLCDRGFARTSNKTCVPFTSPCADHCGYCQKNGKYKCDRCHIGYKLTKNKTCSIHGTCGAHCLFCFGNKDICIICESEYVVTQNYTCEALVAPCANNCVSCQKKGPGKCDLCEPGYKLTAANGCTSTRGRCAAHCYGCMRSGLGKCDVCKRGYIKTLGNTCSSTVKCAEHCKTCWRRGEGKCDRCSRGYILTRDKICSNNVKCANNCLSCKANGENRCDRCEEGYRRTYDNLCTPLIEELHPGLCPPRPIGMSGTCVMECRHDGNCPYDSKCCSNGCGHVCKKTLAQRGPCADNCLSCEINGQYKCDECDRGYTLTRHNTCTTTSPECTEDIEICVEDWNKAYQQMYDYDKVAKLCNLLPSVKECLDDLQNPCEEDGAWITSMDTVTDFERYCAPTTGTTKEPTTPPSLSAAERKEVVMVIRLKKIWKEHYANFSNQETNTLVAQLNMTLREIYKQIDGFNKVYVERLFKSSVGVRHVVVFDHDLTDTERTTLALTLTSALAANSNSLLVGHETITISGKAEMLVGGQPVEVTGTCFLYDKKLLCQNGGSCVARDAAPRCECGSDYSGEFCGVSSKKASTKGRRIVGPVVGGIGACLLLGVIILAILLYRKKLVEKQGAQNLNVGVDNPIYDVFSGRSGRSTPAGVTKK